MKRLSLVIFLFAIGSLAFAQVGIGVHAGSSADDVRDYREQAFIDPSLVGATAEWKFIPILGINGAVLYDLYNSRFHTIEGGVKAYLPLLIVQPSVGVNYVHIPEFPDSYALAMKAGLDIGLLKRFTLGAELTYYGTDLADMAAVIGSADLDAVLGFSNLSIGAKFWF